MPMELVQAAETKQLGTQASTVEIATAETAAVEVPPVTADFEASAAPTGSVKELQRVDVPSADEIVAAEATMLETPSLIQIASGSEVAGSRHRIAAGKHVYVG